MRGLRQGTEHRMVCFALWRRLDTPGHDAARLLRNEAGWALRGTAVFQHEAAPACLTYAVDLDPTWKTQRGRVQGFAGNKEIQHVITRQHGGWIHNDELVEGLDSLVDLDFGFTPATNLQQLRRISLQIGEAADLAVAWLDAGSTKLVKLPQRYERRGKNTYWYEALSVPYQGMLEMADDGFIMKYPELAGRETPISAKASPHSA